MSDDDEISTNKKHKKIQSIDKKKLYISDPEEEFNTNNKKVINQKNFETGDERTERAKKKINKKKESSSSLENNSIISDENESRKNDSSDSSNKENNIIKHDISDSSNSSKSNYSSSNNSESGNSKKNESIKNSDIESSFCQEIIHIKLKEKERPTSKNDDNKFLKDKKDDEDIQITEKLISEISSNLKICKGQLEKEMEEIRKHKEFFDEKNFILTDLSCKRMAEIIHYIKSGNPVLLEGDTGTAKTRTSVIACEYLMKFSNNENEEKCNYIKFNLSADTKIDNLMNKYVGDNKSVSGIKIENGAFYKAFVKGKILILDEINLASKEVLDCIGQALDSKILSTELTGKELESFKMHPNFALIATQNPLKGSFINKRQNLGYAFFSRFQKVNCDKFSEEELFNIAIGLAKKGGANIDENILKNIIKFHIEWEK